jgi:putative endonuclease
MIWLTKLVVRGLEFAGRHFSSRKPQHLLTGKRGELEAYLHLRALGYRMVAANFRVPYDRGEIDLIGWDEGVLCFIEVKTRTNADFAPPSTAVDLDKKKHIRSVARRYVRRLPGDRPPPCRFDIVCVIVGDGECKPEVTLQKGAFSWDSGRPRKTWSRDFRDHRFWQRRR